MIVWALVVVGIVIAIYASLIIGEEVFDDSNIGLAVGGIIAILYFLKNDIWEIFVNGYSLFMESPIFWTFVLIVIVALLFTKPRLLIAALIFSSVIYLVAWLVFGTPISIYAFFGWTLAILATTPIAGVPIILMVIGGYFVGRWMAKL